MLASSLVISLLLANSRCAVCPCVITPGEDLARPATVVPRAYQTAGVVFSGRVVRVDTSAKRTVQPGADSTSIRPPVVVADTVRYRVAVDEVWKGSLLARRR